MGETKIMEFTYSDGSISNGNHTDNIDRVVSKGFTMHSENGCIVQIQGPIDGGELSSMFAFQYSFTKDGGVLWTNMSSDYVSWYRLKEEQGETPAIHSGGEITSEQWSRVFIYRFSGECAGRDLLLVSPQWIEMPYPAKFDGIEWEI